MGEAADRKVKEIELARAHVEEDLRELEARLSRPVHSAKAVAGAALGSSVIAGALGWWQHRRKQRRQRATEGGA